MLLVGMEALRDFSAPGTHDLHALAFHDATALDLSGVVLEGKRQRTAAETRALEQKIGLIARVFSRNYDLDVLPSPVGGWSCGIDPKITDTIEAYLTGQRATLDDLPAESFRPKQILYDVKDVAEDPEDEVLGVLRHEVGHANHSDYRLFFKGQRLAHEQGYLPSGWANIHNALEDPWVNNKEIAGSEVVREKMTKRYAASMPEVVAKINTQPLTRQLGLNIIHHWLTGQSIPTLTDKRVLEMFERIKPHAEAYFKGTDAQTNFDNLLQNIWPSYKEIETKALSDEETKELARRAAQQNLGQPKPGEGNPQEGQEGQGRQGNQSGIKKALQRFTSAIKRAFGGGDGSKPSEEQKQIDEDLKGKVERDLQKALQQELKRQTEDLRSADKELKQKGEKTGAVPDDIDLNKLSQQVRQQLESLKKSLQPEQKQALEKQARNNLDAKQAEALKEDAPGFMQPEQDSKTGERRMVFKKGPSASQVKLTKEQVQQLIEQAEDAEEQTLAQEAADQEERDQQTAEQIRAELERREMLQAGFTENEQDLYRKFKDLETPMQGRIRNFIQTIEKFLPKQETYNYGGEYYTGRKIDQRSLPERAPVKDYRIYQRRQPIAAPQARMYITLVIDNSGSMRGEKMEESLKTAVFWGRVLQEFGIPFSIKFFGDQVRSIKTFEQDYDDGRNRVKPNLVKHADASGGSTDMGAPLTETEKEMNIARRKFANCVGAVFVISDSGANRGLTGPSLTELIRRLQKNYIVSNFILSTNKNEVAEAESYFGEKNVIAPKNFTDLPDEAFRVLRVTLERMLRLQGGVVTV